MASHDPCCLLSRRHGNGGRRELQPGPEAAVLPGQGLRQEEQHPHHGRGHRLHRHGNSETEALWLYNRLSLYYHMTAEYLLLLYVIPSKTILSTAILFYTIYYYTMLQYAMYYYTMIYYLRLHYTIYYYTM